MILQPQYGLACPGEDCKCNSLGAVSDYDLIRIGGRDYSASELYAKAPTIFAQSDTKVYSGADFTKEKYITKAGNPLGKYYSYLKPTVNRPKGWIMLQTGQNLFVYVPNEAIGSGAIANQGIKTAQEQLKEEAAAKEKENDPIFYYIKRVGVPLAIGLGVVYLVATFGKAFIEKKVK
jgi:hypothetical protein